MTVINESFEGLWKPMEWSGARRAKQKKRETVETVSWCEAAFGPRVETRGYKDEFSACDRAAWN